MVVVDLLHRVDDIGEAFHVEEDSQANYVAAAVDRSCTAGVRAAGIVACRLDLRERHMENKEGT